MKYKILLFSWLVIQLSCLVVLGIKISTSHEAVYSLSSRINDGDFGEEIFPMEKKFPVERGFLQYAIVHKLSEKETTSLYLDENTEIYLDNDEKAIDLLERLKFLQEQYEIEEDSYSSRKVNKKEDIDNLDNFFIFAIIWCIADTILSVFFAIASLMHDKKIIRAELVEM